MQLFYHGQHGQRHGWRARAPNDDDDVAQHGDCTPASTKFCPTEYVFDMHLTTMLSLIDT